MLTNYYTLTLKIIVFDCFRVWAITQHQWIPTILIVTFAMFDPLVNIVCAESLFLMPLH